MAKLIEKLFDELDSGDQHSGPPMLIDLIHRLHKHSMNNSTKNKTFLLDWGDYIMLKSFTGLDLREELYKKSDVAEFYTDQESRFVKLGYKNYETHLYFDHQIKALKSKSQHSEIKHWQHRKPLKNDVPKIIKNIEDIRNIPGISISDYIFADTETTGLFHADHVIELALVDIHEKILFESLLKPKRKRAIHPKAFGAHGIHAKELINQPKLIDIQDEVCRLIKGKLVIFYNANFDVAKMIHSSNGKIFDETAGVACLMRLYESHYHTKAPRLTKACDELSIDYSDVPTHRACGDAIKAARIFRKLFN